MKLIAFSHYLKIIIAAFLIFQLFSLQCLADSYTSTFFSPEILTNIIVYTAGIVIAFVSAPNLLPIPATTATNEAFSLKVYFPLQNVIKLDLPGDFKMLQTSSNIMFRNYEFQTSLERGVYFYDKSMWGIPLKNCIVVLTEKEARAGITNPTKDEFNRSPFIGAAMQFVGFPFGLGYVYADEISEHSQWKGIESMLLAGVTIIACSIGNSAGLKSIQNPGLYIGIGSLLWTIYDTVNIINVKNEYAKTLKDDTGGSK